MQTLLEGEGKNAKLMFCKSLVTEPSLKLFFMTWQERKAGAG